MDEVLVKARTRSLLEHFAAITDARPQWKVAYPLPEILLLVVSATIASCDDYDDIVAWGEAHLDFLRRFSPYHHGIPCTDWLRVLMNRMDPDLFSTCFMAWAGELRPDAADLIAIKPAPAQAGGRPRAAAMTVRAAKRRSTSSRLSPRRTISCSVRRRWRTNPARARPFPRCWRGWR